MDQSIIFALSAASAWETALDVLLILAVVHIILLYPLLLATAYIIILNTMRRTSKKMWSRDSVHEDEESLRMRREGLLWAEKHAEYKNDLHIVNEGLNLYGEYYDLGYDRAVIIVSGRTDGLHYGYYFAKPYADIGYNVLCIDQRAHGESDGKYNAMGFDECRDLIAWAELLHNTRGVREIFLHGICIGSACSLYAMLQPGAPDYIVGMAADGMYVNFYESFKLHMIELKKPTFIVLDLVNQIMIWSTGHTMKKGPIDYIDQYDRPILMLHGTSDLYSLPEKAKILYEKCPSKNKKLVWFEGGKHSKLRLSDPEKYDETIKAFLSEVHSKPRT